jgi:hypothetical protein
MYLFRREGFSRASTRFVLCIGIFGVWEIRSFFNLLLLKVKNDLEANMNEIVIQWYRTYMHPSRNSTRLEEKEI